jgi:RNA polymerase sigma factor (TIGR02999 family)
MNDHLQNESQADVRSEVTLILNDIAEGDSSKINKLIPLVYNELNKIARRQLYGERPGCTFNPTALAHEAYIKLVNQENLQFNNRAHFFALASQAMRRILVDYARAKKAQKRGGENEVITFIEDQMMQEMLPDDVLALNEALENLKKINERQSRMIQYWFFGGLNHSEIAEVLNISVPSVRRDWRFARAWLSRELKNSHTDIRFDK